MVRSKLKSLLEFTVSHLPSRVRDGHKLVFSYHNIVHDNAHIAGDASLHLTQSHFCSQIQVIRQRADIVPLIDLLEYTGSHHRLASITFDDAYLSSLELGVTACNDAEIPCTVFVSPDLLGTFPVWDIRAANGSWGSREREEFLWRERGRLDERSEDSTMELTYVSRETIIATEAELADVVAVSPLLTLGNHTSTHCNLGALSTQEATDELMSAQSWLMERFPSQTIPVVAYPFGIPPKNSPEILGSSSLDYGMTIDGGWIKAPVSKGDAYVPRWNIPSGLSASAFSAGVRGHFITRK